MAELNEFVARQFVTVSFEVAKNYHPLKIFHQPLFYLANNLIQNIYKLSNNTKKYDEKLIDNKLEFEIDTDETNTNNIKLEMSMCESIGFENSSIDDIKLNMILDRFNTHLKFKYDGVEFTIKTYKNDSDTADCANNNFSKKEKEKEKEKKMNGIPFPLSHSEHTEYTRYEIKYKSIDLEKFDTFIKTSIQYYHIHFEGCIEDSNKITMCISNDDGSYFEHLGRRNKRSLDTVYLPNKQKADIISDLTKFLKPETKQRYAKLGVNYKRIYLLEGVPGSGKSSFIMGLASKFNYNIAIVSFTPKMTDVNLIRALRSLNEKERDRNDNNENNKKFFIVFEDMDCIFKARKSNDESKNSITFSGLLNALDGITTNENLICFITTNYKNNLDSALIRPGRVDYIMNFDYANKQQITDIFKVYTCEIYDSNTDSLQIDRKCKEFYEALNELNIQITTSLLQQYLMKYLDKPNDAISNVDELKKMYEASKVALETGDVGLYN